MKRYILPFAGLLVLLFVLAAIFFFAREHETGVWVCEDGTWIAEGAPKGTPGAEECSMSPSSKAEAFETFIRANIGKVSPSLAVLGGTFYVTFVQPMGDGKAVVEYEDGHIALLGYAEYGVTGGAVTLDRFENFEESFNRSGNLMKDNPGLTPGVWYLSYETAGAPGLSTKLSFPEHAVCTATDGSSCAIKDLVQGDRIRVMGNMDGDTVTVRRIEK
jgi:hypothetical protein